MSFAELDATIATRLLRGGRSGDNYFTNNAALDAKRAHQRLGLDGPLRDVRMTFEIQNDVAIYGPRPAAPGRTGTPAGGIEFFTTDTTAIKIIKVQPLRK
jgi:hypothetical protein